MPYPTTKIKIKRLVDGTDLSFYRPKPVLAKYGYKQKDLAEKMGISQGTLSVILLRNPNIAQIKLMADAIGCSFFEFFDFSDDAKSSEKPCGAIVDSCCRDYVSEANRVECPVCGAALGLVAL